MKKALLLIDLQNDYFFGGKYPLWNAEATLANSLQAVESAQRKGISVVLIQHVADSAKGVAPFFNAGSEGACIHPRLLAAAPDAPVVVKAYADAFYRTNLEQTLAERGITDLLIGGMMTQNCVTHTVLSKAAEKYCVSVLPDCCTTAAELLHKIALSALSIRVPLVPSAQAV